MTGVTYIVFRICDLDNEGDSEALFSRSSGALDSNDAKAHADSEAKGSSWDTRWGLVYLLSQKAKETRRGTSETCFMGVVGECGLPTFQVAIADSRGCL